MGNRNKKRYTCADCKWNLICKDDAIGRCEEFILDRIMSDTFADKVIERNRRAFNEDYYEYLSAWKDV